MDCSVLNHGIIHHYKKYPMSQKPDDSKEGVLSRERDVCSLARDQQLHPVPGLQLHYPWRDTSRGVNYGASLVP